MIPLQLSLDSPESEEETSSLVEQSRGSTGVPWYWSPWRWTLLYAGLFLLCTIFFQWVTTVVLAMHYAATNVWIFGSLLALRRESRSQLSWELGLSILYVLGLSILVSGMAMPSTTANWYANAYFWIKPNSRMETILKQLQYDSKLPDNLSYEEQHRPLQALGLGNGYLDKMGQALEVHFDRIGSNQTQEFDHVRTLNLIGNLFDDRGARHVLKALEHPNAYTEGLLLSRNDNLGDETAERVATLIVERKNTKLTWLGIGRTAITAKGIHRLYLALGTRPFAFLGLDYTYRPQWWKLGQTNPIAQSIGQLHRASGLQELSLTGNHLKDLDMAALAANVRTTNLTTLGLTDNQVGPQGLRELLPLTAQLKEWYLNINPRIGDEGAVLLAEALKSDASTLELLSLSGCNIGQRGAEAFLSIFPDNTKLKHLFIDGQKDDGGIHPETLQAIEVAVERNWE